MSTFSFAFEYLTDEVALLLLPSAFSGLHDNFCGPRSSLLWILCLLLIPYAARAQNDTFQIVSSTIQPVQCASYWFFWTGGVPPFELQVGPIDNTQHIDSKFGIDGQNTLWDPVDLLGGTHLVLLLTDSTGRQTIDSSWAVVQPSDDDSCLPEDAQGRGAAGSSTAQSTSVSSSTTSESASSRTSPPTTSSPTMTPSSTRRATTSTTSTQHTTFTSSKQSSSTQLSPTGAVANSTPLPSSTIFPTSSPPSSSSNGQSTSSTSTTSTLPSSSAVGDSAHGQKSMGSGAIAGIAVGAAVALLVALASLLLCYKRRHQARSPSTEPPEDLSDVDPFSALPAAPSPSAKRAVSPFMYDRSSSAMSPFRAASPSISTPTPSVLVLRDHAGSSTYPQDGSRHPTHPSEFSPYTAYSTQYDDDARLPRPLIAKSSMAELSRRSDSATALLADRTPRSAEFSGGLDPASQDPESDDLDRRLTATDGGVRLAGGPPGEAPDSTPHRRGEMFPPPYHRY
ncbi:hypothetical protein L226DRAFT_570027 [Lentinus tigrinus ALCF2SS1-7]|uniref:Mid2 domain-containing protein n=1 Tax=Lentinus tigrinus ALCF2SS1-6 TaxID=1328759 RepID=A0A5C2S9Z2_9APHY|nr:hypothetical protein L227DRAFT_653232 [Lentinus tigrinus ALCF2SS1-6]RPD75779.1 hypothetical protein L226DRAFT_570027 [Lentinus tigrinus ALCF2SS1-7]